MAGRHTCERIDATGNEQLQAYALGILCELEVIGYSPKHFVLHIVQPRLYHYDSWKVGVSELKRFGTWLAKAAKATTRANPKVVPGEKQCRWCKHKPHCVELAEHCLQTAIKGFSNLDEVVIAL